MYCDGCEFVKATWMSRHLLSLDQSSMTLLDAAVCNFPGSNSSSKAINLAAFPKFMHISLYSHDKDELYIYTFSHI